MPPYLTARITLHQNGLLHSKGRREMPRVSAPFVAAQYPIISVRLALLQHLQSSSSKVQRLPDQAEMEYKYAKHGTSR